MNDALTMAKWYLEIGWSLLPILPETKTPAVKWAEFQEKQPTLEQVTEWINKGWFLAVVTGDISGIAIIDDDRLKHGLNEWGFTSSICAKTQNNGRHYYFKYDRELHSHSNGVIRVDLKAWHSYCLLPPFGGRDWIGKPSRENLAKLTPIPDDIIRLINSDTKTADGQRQPIVLTDFITIPEGTRNDSLHRLACSLFNKLPEAEVIGALVAINQTYTPPLTDSEFQYQVTRAKNFVSKGQPDQIQKPRSMGEIGKIRVEERKLEAIAPSTGYPELDDRIKGFVPKHVYTLTGETNVGKTAIACNFVERLRRQGKKCLYIALEPDTTVVDYLAAIRTGKNFDDLTSEDLTFEDNNVLLYGSEIKTPEELGKVISEAENKFDLVVVDHIGYFVNETVSFIQQQANILKKIAIIANKTKIAVLIIAHLRKPDRSNKNYIPTINDISGSAAFKQDSDEVMIVIRDRDTNDEFGITYLNTGKILCVKNKVSRKNGIVPLIFSDKSALIRTPREMFEPQLNQEDYLIETAKEIFK